MSFVQDYFLLKVNTPGSSTMNILSMQSYHTALLYKSTNRYVTLSLTTYKKTIYILLIKTNQRALGARINKLTSQQCSQVLVWR